MCHFIYFRVTFGTHPESFFLPSSKKPLAISTFQRQVQRIVRMFDDTRRWEGPTVELQSQRSNGLRRLVRVALSLFSRDLRGKKT